MLGIMIIKEGFMHVQIIFRSNVTGASLKPLKSFVQMLLLLTSLQHLRWDPNPNPSSGQLNEIVIIRTI